MSHLLIRRNQHTVIKSFKLYNSGDFKFLHKFLWKYSKCSPHLVVHWAPNPLSFWNVITPFLFVITVNLFNRTTLLLSSYITHFSMGRQCQLVEVRLQNQFEKSRVLRTVKNAINYTNCDLQNLEVQFQISCSTNKTHKLKHTKEPFNSHSLRVCIHGYIF